MYCLNNDNDINEILIMLYNDEEDNESDVQIDDESDTDIENSDIGKDNVNETNEEVYDEESESDDNSDLDYYTAVQKKNVKIINMWKWKKTPFSKKRKLSPRSIIVHVPGVKGVAKDQTNIFSIWTFFIDDAILEIIVNCTNQYIHT
ncbi:hypothetical protein QE152_g38716 [Popillia japonica]|uniref:Uncharacterized protein n=1 Tax=Popillia japonica TaxID=7064 RepID=A0AAW1HWL3_POPJA